MNKFITSYNDGASLEILGEDHIEYKVYFYDDETNELIHHATLFNNHWTRTSIKYYINWKIVVKQNDDIVFIDKLSLKNKLVKIYLTSNSLGDIISWSPYLSEFKRKHECEIIAHSNISPILSKIYPEIKWVNNNEMVNQIGTYATYKIGIGIDNTIHREGIKKLNYYFSKNIPIKYIDNLSYFNKDYMPKHPSFITLQEVCSSILGLEHKEIRPIYKNISEERPILNKYICISEFASAWGLKEWNNKIGWQTLVNTLKELGYDVVSISKEKSNLKNITLRNGDYSLEDRMWYLKHAEFFIGLSSGLSWLNWMVGKKTVMIAPFTENWYEFQEDNIRIINYDACTGCYNSEKHADKFCCFHGSFCPEDKNFECSRKISPKMVIQKIIDNKLINI